MHINDFPRPNSTVTGIILLTYYYFWQLERDLLKTEVPRESYQFHNN